MKKVWPLLALGIGAFALFALVTLPAATVLSFFHPPGVTLSGVSGTIWKGRAQAVRSGNLHVGSVEWDLNILPLFTGKLGADVKITRSDGFAEGSIAVSGARVTVRGLNASLPLGALPPNIVRGGWTGTATLRLPQLAARERLAGRADRHDRNREPRGSGQQVPLRSAATRSSFRRGCRQKD